MNWYKIAEAEEVTVTHDQFKAMSWSEKLALAKNKSISPETQQLFFTEKYWNKNYAIWWLAENTSITLETQRLFFTEEYARKTLILSYLAQNRSISLQAQLLFFTEKYKTNLNALWWLAHNRSISSQTQKMFFTQEYEEKNYVLKPLFDNPSFLKGVTPKEMREFNKIKEARLYVYRKRLKQIRKKIKL